MLEYSYLWCSRDCFCFSTRMRSSGSEKQSLVPVCVRVASRAAVRRAEGELPQARGLGRVASDAAVAARDERVSRGDGRVGVRGGGGGGGACERRSSRETQRTRGLADAADRVGEPDASGTEAAAARRLRARLVLDVQSKPAPALRRQLFGRHVLRAIARCVRLALHICYAL